MNAKKILALLLGAMMLLALAACGAKDNDKQADMSGDGSAMTGEPKTAEEALALHKELLERENALLSENAELWEKLFMAADKGMTMQEDGKNYGDFLLETINAARNAEDLEQIRQAWRKQQQFDNMTLLAAERVYAIKGKGLAQQYKHLTSPAWFRSWKQNHPGSCSDDVLPPSSPQLLPRIFPHPLHNPSYISESRLRINAASSNVTHALEKKAQEFGIYKTSYPDGTPRNPKISEKTGISK